MPPDHGLGPQDAAIDDLAVFLRERRALVLSGAGISTESGIPDYRGVDRNGPPPSPITYQRFVRDEHARRRYWARSALGWAVMHDKSPNEGHRAVAALERDEHVTGVLTQNVDGLHQAAGSRKVVELHGALSRVVCLRCGRRELRASLQARLEALNPGFVERGVTILPDGDADLPEALERAFQVAACLVCGGVLKADVVFFGENVPVPRVEEAFALLDGAEALLVLGSSLAVRSGYRFVEAAWEGGKPVAIVNHGPTRGDDLASVRVEGRLGAVLPELVQRLGAAGAGRQQAPAKTLYRETVRERERPDAVGTKDTSALRSET
ncbi:MAG: NAD-dependent protein deacetylase [Trueperaceae bacterium]